MHFPCMTICSEWIPADRRAWRRARDALPEAQPKTRPWPGWCRRQFRQRPSTYQDHPRRKTRQKTSEFDSARVRLWCSAQPPPFGSWCSSRSCHDDVSMLKANECYLIYMGVLTACRCYRTVSLLVELMHCAFCVDSRRNELECRIETRAPSIVMANHSSTVWCREISGTATSSSSQTAWLYILYVGRLQLPVWRASENQSAWKLLAAKLTL